MLMHTLGHTCDQCKYFSSFPRILYRVDGKKLCYFCVTNQDKPEDPAERWRIEMNPKF